MASKKRIKELTEELKKSKSEVETQRKRKRLEKSISPRGTDTNISTLNENITSYVNLLKKAIKDNDKESCENILSMGEIKNPVFECGETALHVAAANGHAEIVKMILDQGPFIYYVSTFLAFF